MHDVQSRADIDRIVAKFYAQTLVDPIIGFIFTDIAGIDLEHHLPIIGDFWEDVLFSPTPKQYQGNTLAAHLKLAEKIPLRPGHFTRWLYLFEKAVDEDATGERAALMKKRARNVAKSISAALTANKRSDLKITLDDQ